MTRATLKIEFDDGEALEREFETNLTNGGAFCTAAGEVCEAQECDVVLVHPERGDDLTLPARVVSILPTGSEFAAGLAFEGFGPQMRDRIKEFIFEKPDRSAPRTPKTIHEKMRGLSIVEQHRIAREGEVNERVVLERIYGKIVWKEILENPRVTMPEVARIARMGALPLPLLDLIVNNRSWLSGSQVRRALLSNPRLSREQATRVLAVLPRHELKLLPRQSAYPAQIRELARKLLNI